MGKFKEVVVLLCEVMEGLCNNLLIVMMFGYVLIVIEDKVNYFEVM